MFLKIEDELIPILKLKIYSDSEITNETVCKEVRIKKGDIIKVLYIEDYSALKPIEITGRLTGIEYVYISIDKNQDRGKRGSYIKIDCSKEYYNDTRIIYINEIRDIEVIDDSKDNNTKTDNPIIDDDNNKEDIQDNQDITSDIPDGD